MTVTFNPFNPMSYFNAYATAATNTGLALPRVAKGKAIPVELKSEDAGIKVSKKASTGGQVELTFAGTAKGATMSKPNNVWGDYFGAQPNQKVVSLNVAINEAPTTDAFGNTNFTEKNHRALIQTTKKGETGRAIAEDFAKQINSQLLAFRAQVVAGPTADSAKLVITRR
jgi:hypothetical protein